MIKIYYRGGCGSSHRALDWFYKYGIEVDKCKLSEITKEDLLKVLSLSDTGMDSIVKRPGKSKTEVQKTLHHISNMTFNDALDFLTVQREVLQTPIILDEKACLVGYNEEEIRKFLPKEYRRRNLENNSR